MEKVRIKDKMRSAYSPQQWLGVQIEKMMEYQFEDRIKIDNWQIRQAFYHEPGNYEWIDKEWIPYRPGDEWGGENYTAFFRTTVTIPEEFNGKYCALYLKPGGEGLLRLNGDPFAGLDTKHDIVFLSKNATGGEIFDIEIEQTVNEMEMFMVLHRFSVAELVVIDREVENAYFDFKCLYEIMSTPQAHTDVASFLFDELKKAIALVDFDASRQEFRDSLLQAQKVLQDNVYNSGRYKYEGRLNMVGHSHLDLVYQWDYNEFLRKIGRTHSTTLNMMREFPQYLFCQSQLKLYEDLKDLYPKIYDGIKQQVKEGRWEVIGGMYVEPDCNLISGESFVRQLFYGQKIAKEEFGTTSSVCWLPDVFGITWYIPQILRQTGFKYLITNKPVIWNDTNEFPHNTFWWEGPEGSRILAHLPATHFGAKINADIMLTNWNEYKQKVTCPEAIYNYGYADGRGGPNRQDMLTGMRYKGTPGMPESDFTSGEKAFQRMESKAEKLPVMKNELYLETHRGTYTTQARLKRNNRKAEILYRNAEAVSALASFAGVDYPHKELDKGWKLILKNQFHDILPGSHVTEAYHAAMKEYETVFAVGEKVFFNAVAGLTSKSLSKQESSKIAVFNMQPWIRTDQVVCEFRNPGGESFRIVDGDDKEVVFQIIEEKDQMIKVLLDVQNVPAMGYSVFRLVRGDTKQETSFTANEHVLENAFFKVEFDGNGDISSLYDKSNNRYVVEPGQKANQFQLFKDVPGRYAAWDIVPMYKDMELKVGPVEKSEIIENGPVRLVLRQQRGFYNSTISQKIILYKNNARIDFETEIDWQERDRLLKVSFPVNVNAMNATYDLSYGYIERPTHQNTSWDAAKFEVCGHMWADLSEGDYGVSLLNDCKYGHDISGNVMRLTLLKGPQYPDPTADLGKHTFTYSLYPHKGDWRAAQTPRRAWELNDTLKPISLNSDNNSLAAKQSYLSIDKDHVMLSAFKLTEDGKAVILRLYEDQNRRGEVKVSFPRNIVQAFECDPFENELPELEIEKESVIMSMKPFEIKTIKVVFE